ncbi:MAG: hypothetical protein LBI86_00730 [Treponema sp.]|jgi:hypothetical protein|nr:hypothetical protein [Treponema sp.]
MKLLKTFMFLVLPGFLFSCATASFSGVDGRVTKGDFPEGVQELEKGKDRLYRVQDTVLYYLDKGLITHYAGLYGDSSALLEDGERAIEAAYTKSVTALAGSYLINDTVLEYPGEDYEDVYINTFNALNYYHRGAMEDAMVEIRRMNEKVQFLASKYGIVISELQKKALEENTAVPPDYESADFSDSALARYLGMLFHRAAGHADDARIDYEHLRTAFANAPGVYTFPPPSSLEGELDVPDGMARLNVIAFSGLSPVKKEETLRIPVSLSNYVKIALPVLSPRNSLVAAVDIAVDGGKTMSLELLEDIDAVARETFKNKRTFIYFKTIIRAVTKGAASAALDAGSEASEGNAALVFGVLGLANKVFAEVTEKADLRISRYFPARAWVGGLNLAPGSYSFTVNYRDSRGQVISSFRREDVELSDGALNLSESACLK